MKKIIYIASFFAALTAATGCDFLNMIVGRPTSEMVAEKEERIKADEDLRMAIAEIISGEDGRTKIEHYPVESGDIDMEELPFRYYVVLGIFSHHDNARSLAARAKASGYECVLVDWDNGMKAVTVNPTNEISEAYATMDRISFEPFYPQDIWIMNGKRQFFD